METKFNFKSQICTSRSQSERLISLGLKKETADMTIVGVFIGTNEDGTLAFEDVPNAHPPILKKDIPAWSLHRLIEMIQEVCPQVVIIFHRVDIRSNVKRIAYSFDVCDNIYDNLCDCISWLIKEGYFNKDYLEE